MPVKEVTGASSRPRVAESLPELRRGSAGAQVTQLQQLLATAGFGAGRPDGQLGPETEVSVRAFQRSRGLTVDGVVGPRTWEALQSAAATGEPTASKTVRPTLSQGSRGSAVVEMQEALARAGLAPGPADGVFGPQAKKAVLSFQRACGLPADGKCGPSTWAALDAGEQPGLAPVEKQSSAPPSPEPLLKEGASGDAVLALQTLLEQVGYSPGKADGRFGPGTRAAVMAFQSSHGLVSDGSVGPRTWKALRASPTKPETPTVVTDPSGVQVSAADEARIAAFTKQLKSDPVFAQRFLGLAGLYKGKIDGKWGPLTDAAAKKHCALYLQHAKAHGTFDPRSEASILTLVPAAQAQARQVLGKIRASGIDAKIICGTRTYAQQNALYAQGRTEAGNTVTRARGGQSNHNFGVAFDIGIFDGGEYLDDEAPYKKAGEVGVSSVWGMEWGGNWAFVDMPHFQLSTGLTLAELRERFESGRPI